MNTIHWLSIDEYDEWDAFVIQHPSGLVYHLSAWKRFLESSFKHIRGELLALRNKEGRILAGLPLYTVSSWLLGKRTVSVPFATMCDPLVTKKEEFNALWPEIIKSTTEHRIRRVEIRTRHTHPECLTAFLTPGTRYKHHYLPLDKNVDELFNSFNASNICRAIKKAKREGVFVEERKDEDSLRIFHSFLVATRRKHSLPPMPFHLFREMVHSLGPERIALYLGIYNGRPVGGILVSKFRDMWTSEYSGDADDSIRGVSPFIYWEVIQMAKNNGAACFSFGRTSFDNTGLLTHKRRWATIEEDLVDFISLPGGMHEQSQKCSDSATLANYNRAAQLLMRVAPPAVQRLIGDFCYRHLG